MERKIDEWEKSKNVSLEQTDMTDPPPPKAHIEHVNAALTESGKSDDPLNTKKDSLLSIVVNNKIKIDKPIKTSKGDITCARSCVMQSAFLTQGMVSSIPIVFSWGGSIGLEGFRPSILLLTVIIVAVAIVVMVFLVVVDAYIGIIAVVVVGVLSTIKLAFVITGS
nr:hypothetical protein [Tanacetum cinerariifolium]